MWLRGTSPEYQLPWEPITFIFRGYNPYIGGSKPSFFMVLGSKGVWDFMAFLFLFFVTSAPKNFESGVFSFFFGGAS